MAKKRKATKKRTTAKKAGKEAIPKKWTSAKVRRNARGQVQVKI